MKNDWVSWFAFVAYSVEVVGGDCVVYFEAAESVVYGCDYALKGGFYLCNRFCLIFFLVFFKSYANKYLPKFPF